MTIKLTISARESKNSKVKHIPFETKYINTTKESFTAVNTKVVNLNRFKKAGIAVTGITPIMIPTVASAETYPAQPTITPQEILDYGLTIGKMGVGVSVGLSMVLLSITGMLLMLKQKQKSKEWSSDIIKGLIHSLVAIPAVLSIYYIATSLFGDLGFTNPTFLNTP